MQVKRKVIQTEEGNKDLYKIVISFEKSKTLVRQLLNSLVYH